MRKQNIENAIVIPKNLIQNVITAHHNPPLAGHLGIKKTIKAIQIKYSWSSFIKDVTAFIKSCHQCQINKKSQGKPAGCLQPIPLPTYKPLDRITMDFLGPLPSSNNKKYILVFTCQSSKYVIAKSTRLADANTVAKFLIQYITQYGVHRYLTSDRGLHFRNKILNDTCTNFGIKQILSSSYAPQSQGFTERINGVICQAIRHYINRASIPDCIKKAQDIQKLNHDKSHKLTTYEPNQLVLVKFPFQEPNKTAKLAPKYRCPYKIISKVSDVNYMIELVLNNKLTIDVVHINN